MSESGDNGNSRNREGREGRKGVSFAAFASLAVNWVFLCALGVYPQRLISNPPSAYLRGGLTSFTALDVDEGKTHTGTLFMLAAAVAAPAANAPAMGVTAALHGWTDVVQVTAALPLPRTTVVVLPTFCSCASSTTTPNWSPVREHFTVPFTVAPPLGAPVNAFASIVSVTTVKSVNSNAPMSQLEPRCTYRWSTVTLQLTPRLSAGLL